MRQAKVILDNEITDDFVDEIIGRLGENKQVRRTLPGQGRLHMDRNLPFLFVYRRSKSHADDGTVQLIKGEASYLVASAATPYKSGITSLVKAVVESMFSTFGAFLLIEIWAREAPIDIIDSNNSRTAPEFRIVVPDNRIPDETIASIGKALKRIRVSKNPGIVSTVFSKRPWPEKLSSLLSPGDLLKNNCFVVGIEISPIYQDPQSKEIFPIVLNRIHRGVSLALKQGAYSFSQKRTTSNPENYQSLGRRAMVNAVWEVDRKLAEISAQFDFLMMVTPVNIEQAWYKFKETRFEREPVFNYRPINFDPSMLKRQLYKIPIDRIEDPAIAAVFFEKQVELEKKFSMLRDRNTRNFFYGSMQLFGEPGERLITLSNRILETVAPRSREIGGGKQLDANHFAERARQEISRFSEVYPEIASKVVIRDDITGLMVSNGNLFIDKRLKVPESRVEALIQHEVGTHVLTYVNGLNQPLQQLYNGLAGYDELQEGLAVLSEYLVGGLSLPRFRLLAGRVIAAQGLIDGASFVETFRELNHRFGFASRSAYVITSRIYRSGGFTKDAVYLRGLVYLLDYLREGGRLEPLLVGKISIKNIPLINELLSRKVLKPALLSPGYLNVPQSIARLDELRNGKQIFNLI
jgi:uncharacterized protein (TIGR02421 family)